MGATTLDYVELELMKPNLQILQSQLEQDPVF